MSKDALSAWIYVLFVIQYIEIIRTKGIYLHNAKNVIIHVITIIFCIFTKKIETYVLLFSYIPLLIVYIKKIKYLLIPFFSIIFTSFIFMPTIRLTFNISKSGKQEVFSLPFQMTARYVKYNDEKVYSNSIRNYVVCLGSSSNVVYQWRGDSLCRASWRKGWLRL